MELSKEQQIAYNKYIQGQNVFITGPGGAGKTALIKTIYDHATVNRKNIQVTALTGCAAILLNCKAKTIHSWAGIGLGTGTAEQLIAKITKNKFSKPLWKNVNILVIDEVSMLSLKMFNLLNEIGKAVRKNNKPFGGIQLIFSGDFFQLPPVGNKQEPDTHRFCFESDDWNTTFARNCQVQLVKIFRQTDDVYSTILNQIREGKIKRKSNDLLLSFVGKAHDPNLVVEPTRLFPTRNKVENINNKKMEELVGDEKIFKMKQLKDLEMTKNDKCLRRDFTEHDIQFELDALSNNLICEKGITLKIGAQVMCVVNIHSDSDGFVEICNGSQGKIMSFCEITGCPLVKFNNGIERTMLRHVWSSDKIPGIGVSQVPLILAWALTIHKSQGATLDVAELDVGSGIFECGQTYVALSRVKSLSGLYLTSFDASKILVNKNVKDYYASLNAYQLENQEEELPTINPTPDEENPFSSFRLSQHDRLGATDNKEENIKILQLK